MSDAAEVRALIAEAEEIHSDDAYGAFTMMHRLADALEALTQEMHVRELHHFETEKLLVESGIDPDALEAAHAVAPLTINGKAVTYNEEDGAWWAQSEGAPGWTAVANSRQELDALINGAKSFIEAARVPVSRDELAENLRHIHFDGTGCGTTASTACSNCFGPSPMTAREIAEHLSTTYDIYPKADRKPADLSNGDDRG